MENMALGLKGVFHHGLMAQSCLHKNRGSGLNLDSAAAFSIHILKAQNVVGKMPGLMCLVQLLLGH